MKLDTPNADEFPLIFDSWARCWMKSKWAGCVRNCDWDQTSRACSTEIIDRQTTRVTVAVVEQPDGSRRVAGYSVSEPSRKVLHFLYVKRDYRGMGVARSLLRDALGGDRISTWTYTHRTDACDRFLRNRATGEHMVWSPVPARVKA